ncbi:MAG: stress response translation initiation inhibitor YciH [Deltaproteobacteria bacterium]|nr:stress response translation initiation inhibitor YciH [Deltaproteobacteria bacterium]
MTSRLVYSTEQGGMCPRCGRPEASCGCKRTSAAPPRSGPSSKGSSPAPQKPPKDGIARVSNETKGRKGKGVSLVSGLKLDPVALADLAKELKVQCGSGGTVKDGVIEIQGDHRDKLVALLAARGIPAKKVGG